MYTIYLHKKKHSIFDMNGVDVPYNLEKIKYLWKKMFSSTDFHRSRPLAVLTGILTRSKLALLLIFQLPFFFSSKIFNYFRPPANCQWNVDESKAIFWRLRPPGYSPPILEWILNVRWKAGLLFLLSDLLSGNSRWSLSRSHSMMEKVLNGNKSLFHLWYICSLD